MTATYEIGLDTPIHMLTPRQLFEMQAQWMRDAAPPPAPQSENKHRYVRTLAELAAAINSSVATVYRMKKAGLLDTAISQYGRWMSIDVDRVIEIFRLSNIKKHRK